MAQAVKTRIFFDNFPCIQVANVIDLLGRITGTVYAQRIKSMDRNIKSFTIVFLLLSFPILVAQTPLWHFRADTDVTESATGDSVNTWGDIQGSYDASQSTSAQKPLRVDNVLNGKPVIRFRAANTTNLLFPSKVHTAFTFFVYARTLNDSTNVSFLGDSAGVNPLIRQTNGTTDLTRGNVAPTVISLSHATIKNADWTVRAYRFDNTNMIMYLDGVAQDTTTDANTSYRFSQIGYRFNQDPYDGDMAELRMYDSALSETQIINITNKISDYWGETKKTNEHKAYRSYKDYIERR